MNFSYTTGIPDAPNNPSNDQPIMKVNNDSNNGIWTIDHYGFNDNKGGLHKQVRIPVLASIPIGLVAGEGTLYTKTSIGSQLFYSPDASGNEYQMTRTNVANFASFSTNNAYGTPPAGFTQRGGWTFLPGNMLFQYGFYGRPGATGLSGLIQFPFTFNNPPFSITVSLFRNSGNQSLSISSVAPTTTAFAFLTSSAGSDGIYWTAVGV